MDSAWTRRPGLARKRPWHAVIPRELLARPCASKKRMPGLMQIRGRIPHDPIRLLFTYQRGPTDATDSLSSKNCEPKPDSSADLDELRTLDRGSAGPPALPTMAMPRVGCEFLGFRLLAELGAGTFGRVYLGRQERLADRLVVLKIAPHLFDESRTLAQLRHIHIVPIYSVHQTDHFQAVCMPFLGTTTLADLLMDLRRQTVLPESAKYILDQIKKRAHPRAAAGEFPRHDPGSTGHAGPRHSLESMNYVDGVLWLALRLADGLAHAHGCGIVHRDVKPANVLLTDDGMPMLLDFNLSEDRKLDRSASAVGAGGTLRYMAPEQLTHYPTGTCHGDERTDVYSFGVILHELLTGRHPFPQRKNALASACCDGEVKPHQPPKVRHWNPAASPGTESIVRHCLEWAPSRRYQSARELHEDLQRQSEHLPLKYAQERSLRERARKWTRRHPRLSTSAGVGAIAVFLIMAMTCVATLRINHLARSRAVQEAEQTRLQAVAARQRLHDDLKKVAFLLGSDIPGAEHEQHEAGTALAREALGRYQVLEAPRWQEAPLVSALVPQQREQVREDMGELLLLLAGAVARQTEFDLALRLNDLARGCYPTNSVPRAIWRQRALLASAAGQSDLAQQLSITVEATPVRSPRDRYLLLLTEYQRRGCVLEALPWLTEASRSQNDNFSMWLILGNYYAGLAKRARGPGVLRQSRGFVARVSLAAAVRRFGLPGAGQ